MGILLGSHVCHRLHVLRHLVGTDVAHRYWRPRWGATLLVAHWLGRAAPVLAGPLLLDDAGHSCDLLYSLQAMRPVFRVSNIVGISLIALALAMVLVVIW